VDAKASTYLTCARREGARIRAFLRYSISAVCSSSIHFIATRFIADRFLAIRFLADRFTAGRSTAAFYHFR